MFQSVRGREYWFAGGALRQALVDMLNTSPTGSPNQEQMEILIPLADKTAQTWNDLKVATIIHASFSPIPVLACLVVSSPYSIRPIPSRRLKNYAWGLGEWPRSCARVQIAPASARVGQSRDNVESRQVHL